jgi:NAD(P)-dependent dehydrogenase (short-subunit alcohol dehydrogenase family)
LPIDEWRRQFEVNVFGQIAVTQAVLPRLRASRGRVAFVSSLNGRVSTPMRGAYNSSKFAVEGMADTLRMEVRPWGIRVSIIEPAQTDTDIWRDADAALEEAIAALSDEHRALYAVHIDGVRKAIPMDRRMAGSPDAVAAAIERALTARRPRARYVVGALPKMQGVMSRFTPTPMLDATLRKMAGIPRRA